MARNIALEVTLGGVQKSISSLQEFEKELQKLQDELGIVSQESTESFQQMSQEISKVNQDFEMLTQNLEDVDFTETVDQFTTVGDAITETFGDAQTAIQEFGNETDIVAESAKRALNETSKSSFSLTGSLTEMGDKFSQIPGPIGQVAQSVKGLGQAFKILIANPVGLVLAAIALALTTLYKAFTSTKAGAEQMERIFAGLGAVVDVLRDRFLTFVNAIKSLLTFDFKGFGQGLVDTFSGVGEEIAKEANEAARLKGVLQQIADQTRELNKERAKQNVLIADAKLQINDENLSYGERLKALEEVRKAEIALVAQEEELARNRYEAIKAQNALSDSSKEALDEEANAYVELQNKILQSKQKQKELFDQEKALRDKQRAEQKAADDERKRVEKEAFDRRKAQIEEIKKLATEELTQQIEALKLLRKEISNSVPEPQIITQLNEIRNQQKALTDQFKQPTFEELKKQLLSVVPPYEQAADSVDKFGKLYKQAQRELSTAAQGSRDDFELISTNLINAFTDAFLSGEITKPALDAFKEILEAYNKVNENINIGKDGGLFDVNEFYKLYRDVKIVNGEIINDINKAGEVTRATTKKTYTQAIGDLETFEKGITDKLRDYYIKNDENVKKLLKSGAKKEAEDLIKTLTQTYLENLKITSDSIIKQEQLVGEFFSKSTQLQTDRQKEQTKTLIGFIGQNTDLVLQQLVNTVGLAEGAAEDAFEQLVESTIDTTNLTEEELNALLQIYGIFYQKLDMMRKTDKEKEEQTLKEKREAQLSNIEALSSQLGEVSSTLSQFSDFALEKLATQEEEALNSIVGTTEQANQKRLELAQQYEGKRREIEKQTRIQELEFARIQAIAEGAVAVIRSASNPILTPLTVALVAAQVSLISSQIQQARSLQRGGMLQFGGLLEGPSHEQGGIRFGQMGIELEGGEAVINRVSTAQYGSLLSTINQAGGGRPLVSSGFDDSRLLEALSKQRSEPIRAYVLEQEITNKQAVSSRLESLSTL